MPGQQREPTRPPILSIVTPSRNQGRYLPRCLDSVADQPLGPGLIEHLVMDAASEDGSADLLCRATHLAYWQSRPDGGQSAAINQALRHHARGRYATWLNADDWYEPGALATIVHHLAQPDAPDVLVARCRFERDGRTIFEPAPPSPIALEELLRPLTRWFAGRLIVQPEAFFRRELFLRVGGLNEANHYTMDHELWLRLLEDGARFATIDLPVAVMRAHEGQKTADNAAVAASFAAHARPVLERTRARLGPAAADAIDAELATLEDKLALARAVRRELEPLTTTPPTPPTPPHPTPDASEHAPCPLPGPAALHAAPLRALLAGLPRALRTRRYAICGPMGAPLPAKGDAATPGDVERALADVLPAALPHSLTGRWRPLPLGKGGDRRRGRADLVVGMGVLARSADPAHVLAALVSLARPGGLVVLAADLAPCGPALAAHAAALIRLADEHITYPHRWVIAPEAMPWARALAAADGDIPARARWPHPLGVDAGPPAAAAGLSLLESLPYGGANYHPLTPFATPEAAGRHGDCWACSLWRVPGGA